MNENRDVRLNTTRPTPSRRPPLVPTVAVLGAVVVLLFLAGSAAVRILTLAVELMLLLVALGVLAVLGRYLWRRGGAPPN